MSKTFIICDGDGAMVSLEVKMFGRRVAMSAMFLNEDDALEILYVMEERGLLPTPHRVVGISSEI